MNRLKQLRNEKNLLQEDLGKVIGVSGRAIGNYENEKRKMSSEIILRLADYFGVSSDYLLCKTDIRNSEELKEIPFANAGGLDINGLDEEDLKELQKQVDYIKKLKGKSDEKK